MDDVLIGKGELGGHGVYAGRDFAADELVLSYELQPISEVRYRALPGEDRSFVHSFGGQRYLYPVPARFVNHADQPTCSEDFDRSCYVARRDITAGEPITIDAAQETARELATFLDAYSEACRTRSAAALAALIDTEAVHWTAGRAHRGRDAVVAALVEEEVGSPADVEWMVGTGRWEAICSAICTGQRNRHLTALVKIVQGNWQLVYQHLG